MKFEKKYAEKPKDHIILNLDLSLDDDFLEIDLDTNTLNDDSGKSDGTEISARCVFVATKTTLPAPDGRRIKKKSFKAKNEIIKFRCTIYEKKVLKVKAKNQD